MVQEQYVSFEVAKLLKEKGFRAITNRYYNAQYDEIRTVSDTFMMDWNDEERMSKVFMPGSIAIPTQQMACAWLRLVHHIHVCPEYKAFFQERPKKVYHCWCCKIVGIDRYFKRGINEVDVLDPDYFFFHDAKTYHESYEDACNECIEFALKKNLIKET